MKTVLVQYPSTTSEACGVWWDEAGNLRSYYPFSTAESAAARTMALAFFANKSPDASWEDMFRAAADRMPRSVSYELGLTDDPVAYLERLIET